MFEPWRLFSVCVSVSVSCAPEAGTGGEPAIPGPGGQGGGAFEVPAAGADGGNASLFGPRTNRDSGGGAVGCVATAAGEAALEPVTLAFAFDVSGSMGKLDFPYHDPELKWRPVVAATGAFFEDPASAGISASLTFFPIDDDDKCESASYVGPDVPITALPSSEFGSAIDRVTPQSEGDWIGGTPTLAVIQGTLEFIRPLAEADPRSRYAVVLVSDGYPQGCDDDDIASVEGAVSGVAATIPTYVIGVSNPPGGPDTVSNLDRIAVAGRTDRAFLIETGDPARTKDAFGEAVRGIRAATIACEFDIPPPPQGTEFDPVLANVTYASGPGVTPLVYDEACAAELAWRYDDPGAPGRMVLCERTCAAVKADSGALLRIEFGCARRESIR